MFIFTCFGGLAYILFFFLSRLKFTADGSGRAFFISSDMFYLEVIVEQGGSVCEVHIQHEGKSEPQTCNEIAVCLNSGNFSKFTSHLQVTIYCFCIFFFFNSTNN